MKYLFSFILVLSIPLFANQKANIILIKVDDMGWTDIGAFGSKYYHTPNMDRLIAGAPKFDPNRPLVWHFPIYLQKGNHECHDMAFRTRPGSVIRIGDWKLHQYFENNRIELYNLKDDLSEKNNLAKQHPEKVEKLLAQLHQWRKDKNAPVPTDLNPLYVQGK